MALGLREHRVRESERFKTDAAVSTEFNVVQPSLAAVDAVKNARVRTQPADIMANEIGENNSPIRHYSPKS